MNLENRTLIIQKSAFTGEVKSIRYDKKSTPFPVQEIPLEALIYNPYNGRIRSLVKSFESSQNRQINPEDPDDVLTIEQYLYDSARGKNDKTLESLKEIGQQEIGIVTKDGVIIDGNRRAMLLNIIYKDDPSRNLFKAIVLPDNLQDNEKEITLLETRYQMGVDSKVDYNPIEKYIRCRELKDIHDLTILEIAEIMAESVSKINEWLNILELMEKYLVYLNSPKIYTRLEKREGHFVDLHNYLNIYKSRANKNTNWNSNDDDLIDLEQVYFDYIRLGIPVQRARVLAKPTSGNSFFCKKEIWLEFILEHKDNKQKIIEEKFTDVKKQQPNSTNEDIIRDLDSLWKKELEERLLDNLSFNESNLKDIIETYNPLKLLKRVRNSIGQINPNSVEVTTKNEVIILIDEIIIRLDKIKNDIL